MTNTSSRDGATPVPPHNPAPAPPTPRWVKVLVACVLFLIVLVLILHLTGMAGGSHMHGSFNNHTRQSA